MSNRRPPRGRYVKRNVVDYLVILCVVLLFLSLAGRILLRAADQPWNENCRAEVQFVVRDADEETKDALLASGSVFRFGDATDVLAQLVSCEPNPLDSDTYDLTYTFSGRGHYAADRAFLLDGRTRVTGGDRLTVTQDALSLPIDVIRVRVS